MAAARDVDGDGHDDVLIGAPGGGRRPGAAYVRSGKDGSLLATFSGEAAGDQFGKDILGVGDVDGDGVPDHKGPKTGRIYVVSGASVLR